MMNQNQVDCVELFDLSVDVLGLSASVVCQASLGSSRGLAVCAV